MKKLIIVLVLIALFLCTFFLIFFDGNKDAEGDGADTPAETNSDSAVSDSGTPYDYDLSEYVTLGAYPGVEVDLSEVAEYVEQAKTEVASEHAVQTEVTDRAVQNGDTVNIDYAGTIDGVAFDGGTDVGADLTIGSGQFIDGFEEGLIGKNIGEEVALDLSFPDSYHNAEFAGKAVVFTVKINKITANDIPELTDEMVKELGSAEYATVAEFDAYLNEHYNEALTWQNYFASCEIKKYPDSETDGYYQQEIEYYESMASYYGTDIATLATSMGYSDTNVFYEQIRETAKQRVAAEMVIYQTVRVNNISVTDEEYQALALELALANGFETVDALKEQVEDDVIMLNIYQKKIIQSALEAK